MIALLIYDTDCLTSGNCNIWSWIRTVLYAILPVLGIVLTIMGYRQLSSQDTQMQDTQMQMMPVYSENK